MNTIIAKVKNSGNRAQVLRTYGGTVTVKSGETLDQAEIYPLDEQLTAHYAARGVTVTPVKDKKARSGKATAPTRADLETAVKEAKAALEAANEGSDLGAQASAQKAFDEAEKALAAHKD